MPVPEMMSTQPSEMSDASALTKGEASAKASTGGMGLMRSRNSKKVKFGRYRKTKRQNGRSGWKIRPWST